MGHEYLLVKMTINVGIKQEQKDKIIKLLKYRDTINGFVQKAVEKELKLRKIRKLK